MDAPPLGGWEGSVAKKGHLCKEKAALQKMHYSPLTPEGELNPHRQVMKGIVSF